MNESEDEIRQKLIEALEASGAEARPVQMPTVLFDAEDERTINSIAGDVVSLMRARGVTVADGVMAMLIMASQHIDMIPDEDAAQELRMSAVAILLGHYEFRGETH